MSSETQARRRKDKRKKKGRAEAPGAERWEDDFQPDVRDDDQFYVEPDSVSDEGTGDEEIKEHHSEGGSSCLTVLVFLVLLAGVGVLLALFYVQSQGIAHVDTPAPPPAAAPRMETIVETIVESVDSPPPAADQGEGAPAGQQEGDAPAQVVEQVIEEHIVYVDAPAEQQQQVVYVEAPPAGIQLEGSEPQLEEAPAAAPPPPQPPQQEEGVVTEEKLVRMRQVVKQMTDADGTVREEIVSEELLEDDAEEPATDQVAAEPDQQQPEEAAPVADTDEGVDVTEPVVEEPREVAEEAKAVEDAEVADEAEVAEEAEVTEEAEAAEEAEVAEEAVVAEEPEVVDDVEVAVEDAPQEEAPEAVVEEEKAEEVTSEAAVEEQVATPANEPAPSSVPPPADSVPVDTNTPPPPVQAAEPVQEEKPKETAKEEKPSEPVKEEKPKVPVKEDKPKEPVIEKPNEAVKVKKPIEKPAEKVETKPTEKPVVKEAPTEKPVVKESPTEKPVLKEAPTEKPVAKEAPTEKPVVKEAPTEKPVAKEAPTEKPVVKEVPTEKPVEKEVPTEKPVAKEVPTEMPAPKTPVREAEEIERVRAGQREQEKAADRPADPPVASDTDQHAKQAAQAAPAVDEGIVADVEDDSPDAAGEYDKADVTGPEDWDIRAELDAADNLVDTDDAAALSAFGAILARRPRSPRALWGRARALNAQATRERSNNLLDKAIKAFRDVLDLDLEAEVPLQLYRQAAESCVQQMRFRGQLDQAARIQQRLIQKFPDDYMLRNHLATVFMTYGQNAAAEEVLQEVLRLWPENGYAKVHLGFIRRQEGNHSAAVTLMQAGIDSDEPGVHDKRFYYALGDSYDRTGRRDLALKVYEEGVKRGLLLSVLQRSLINVDRLTGRPYWTPEQAGSQALISELEAQFPTIRGEMLALLDSERPEDGFQPEQEQLSKEGDWKQYTMYRRGRKNQYACVKTPRTCEIIDKFPEAAGCRRGQVKFSMLAPGTTVWPHTGPTNCRLRLHLGIKVPPGTGIRVAGEKRTWEEGKVLIIDDSFEHDVWNEGTESRFVLIVDIWHPELTEDERRTLTSI
ncbi:aspartyl/asparaginyl beta-hydroxylase-like isoform X3 [Amphibalanus amphitrite]|uniref:aspartyl/asparaginyl beta-hydroxylase-like isoform X3 n=1 Tax=Amphibalanus amphitrite TaxID=1232801 RepID=UPI001C917C0B|nr:aspartyl/asparaginyl beta-hydroxylase-like isoform X3 [Amphibalanus amphitrite]